MRRCNVVVGRAASVCGIWELELADGFRHECWIVTVTWGGLSVVIRLFVILTLAICVVATLAASITQAVAICGAGGC